MSVRKSKFRKKFSAINSPCRLRHCEKRGGIPGKAKNPASGEAGFFLKVVAL